VLCWRPVNPLEGEDWGPYLQALDQLAEAAEREVLWLPFHRKQDRGLLTQLAGDGLLPAALQARSREVAVQDPAEAMECFRSAGLVVAMRLHGLILAALAGSPCAALSYDPKVGAAAAAIGCPRHDLGELPGADMVGSWRSQLDHPVSTGRIEVLRQQTRVHREVLQRLGSLPARP
jgi:polysaccharide pyruvyl transferase WcaK-like protein